MASNSSDHNASKQSSSTQTFKFVNVDNADPKPMNQAQRRLIRSQATRVTRAQEAANGTPRKTRSKIPPPLRAPISSINSIDQRVALRSTNTRPIDPFIARPWQSPPQWPLPISAEGCLHVIDPFNSLPVVQDLPPKELASCWKYCCEVFIPMTTPLRGEERALRCRRVLQSAETKPGTFYGHMAMVEMHRLSIVKGDAFQDPEVVPLKAKFFALKQEAYRSIIVKEDRKEYADGEVAEGLCALACAYMMTGEFPRARDLIGYSRHIARNYGLELGPAARAADAKAALATFGRPLFPVQRPYESVPESIMSRARPTPENPLNRLGTTFEKVPISETLQGYLAEIRVYCFCYEARQLKTLKLSGAEAQLLASRVQQTEVVLLDYPYHNHDSIVEWENLPLEPLERLVQMTALASLSRVDVYAPADSAVGQITAQRQRKVIDTNMTYWLSNANPPRAVLEIILWATLFAIQSTLPQEQEPLYEHLKYCAALLGVTSWLQAESILYRLLYIPSLLRTDWETIWEQSQTPRWLTIRR